MATSSFTPSDVEAMVRDVSEDELAFYREHGWVMMRRLIPPELAAELSRVGQEMRRREAESGETQKYGYGLLPEAEPFGAFEFSPTMLRNAERFIDRRRLNPAGVAIRYGGDNFLIKPPGAGGGASYHQDAPEHGSDRVGETRFWVAVDTVTAGMGPMRFIDRSHQEGLLGTVLTSDGEIADLLEVYPKLAERLTEPMEYEPGDATVHSGYMGHGSGPNTTDRPRLSFLLDYIPADIRYWGATYYHNPGSTRVPLDEQLFPVVYTPGG
jgi:hypothetical protein